MMADPLEIAKLAVHLAPDDSAYVVGADFLIDGEVTIISAVGAELFDKAVIRKVKDDL